MKTASQQRRAGRLLGLGLATAMLTCAFAALAACSSGAPSETSGLSLTGTPEMPSPPVDHPPIDPAKKPVTSAVAQRISVAQLRGAFPVILGKDVNGKGRARSRSAPRCRPH